MEPKAHSQKNFSFEAIEPDKYKKAIAAQLGFATSRLFAGPQQFENDTWLLPVEAKINIKSREATTGYIAKVFVDNYWGTVSFVASYPLDDRDDAEEAELHLLLTFTSDEGVTLVDGSRPVIITRSQQDGPKEKKLDKISVFFRE